MRQAQTFGKLRTSAPAPAFQRVTQPAASQPMGQAADRLQAAMRGGGQQTQYAAAAPMQRPMAPVDAAVSETDMMRAIGGNWPKFRGVWQDMDGDPDSIQISFGVAPFFFNSLWLLYRKQYGWFFVFLAANIAIPFAIPEYKMFAQFALNLLCGLLGHWIVVSGAMKLVRNVRSSGCSNAEGTAMIERSGGTSLVGFGLFVVVLFAIGFVLGATGVIKNGKFNRPAISQSQMQR